MRIGMGLFGTGKKAEGPTFEEIAAVILSERTIIRILAPIVKANVKNVANDGRDFTLYLDGNEPTTSMVVPQEQMTRIFKEYYQRDVIEVIPFEEGHEMYLVRFEE
jgi:hypothetical protein